MIMMMLWLSKRSKSLDAGIVLGIIGNEEAKFTKSTKIKAERIIRFILSRKNVVAMVSGRSPLGGIDIWAEEIAKELGVRRIIFPPKVNSWSGKGGYRDRNLKIARESDIVHVIVVRKYPSSYDGMRFKKCYHCNSSDHVKSGACWTARKAMEMGKSAMWHKI